MKRLYSIDVSRGLVMIIMALDHVRDLLHVHSIDQSPTDLQTTTPLLFFTRWVTYLCAPAFVFLAGTSAALSLKRSTDTGASRRFLLKRGVYLILLEFAVINLALFFDPAFHTLIFEVIATIGFGFIMLALTARISAKLITAIGLLIIFSHNLAPLIPFAETSFIKQVLMPLFAPAAFPFSGRVFVMAYPPIPWLGIMLTGFGTAGLFQLPQKKRVRRFVTIGMCALLLFIAIRALNIYGDTIPWSVQKTATLTFLSFMNVSKYPPSLVFCLVTLGIMFFLLVFSEQVKNKVTAIASVYGKVPLFYFIIHFFLIHFLLLIILRMQGIAWTKMEFATGTFGRPKGIETGLSLGYVYLTWIAIAAALYLPCKWYGKYKATHSHGWLKYL